MTKVCSRCRQETLLTDFHRDRSKKDGRRAVCIICSKLAWTTEEYRATARQKGRIWRKGNSARLRVEGRERKRRIKLEALVHYSGSPPKCACCGETHIEFLCFDHIEGGGTQHRKMLGNMGRQFYYWLRVNNYPDGYRVLCYNCNMSLGFYRYCPHSKEAP